MAALNGGAKKEVNTLQVRTGRLKTRALSGRPWPCLPRLDNFVQPPGPRNRLMLAGRLPGSVRVPGAFA